MGRGMAVHIGTKDFSVFVRLSVLLDNKSSESLTDREWCAFEKKVQQVAKIALGELVLALQRPKKRLKKVVEAEGADQ